MILVAALLALVAAVLHAAWNILLKADEDPLQFAVRAVTSSALLSTPVAIAAWLLLGRPHNAPSLWPVAVLSACVEVLYFITLSEAYRQGALSVVYPIARGTAPVLAVLAGIFIIRESLHPLQITGVALLIAGMWTVRSPFGSGPAVRPALLTGVFIATYTSIDRVGVHLGPPWLYGWAMWVSTAVLLNAAVWLHQHWYAIELQTPPPDGNDGSAMTPPSWTAATIVGAFMTIAYLLVLIALRIAPLAVVAPLRESAVVLVALWGVWRLREGGIALRLLGAAIILLGIAVLALSQ